MSRLGVCTHIFPVVPIPQGRHVLKRCLQKSGIQTFLRKKLLPCHDRTQPFTSYSNYCQPSLDDGVGGEHQKEGEERSGALTAWEETHFQQKSQAVSSQLLRVIQSVALVLELNKIWGFRHLWSFFCKCNPKKIGCWFSLYWELGFFWSQQIMYEIQQTQNNGAALCIIHWELWQKWSYICDGRLDGKGEQEFPG